MIFSRSLASKDARKAKNRAIRLDLQGRFF
jgi:hypothetical protein